jgi:ATP-dependent helicase/DNAse subunit B
MITQSEELIVSNFQIVYVNGDISKGKNKLIFEVSKKYLNRFLRLELEEIIKGKEIKIIALEQKLSSQLEIEGLNFPVTIRGIVDRIDTVDGRLRILDYKTGMVKESDLRMPDFSLMKEGYKYTKALQVMLYVHLYRSNTNVDVSNVMEAGIISFKNLNRGFLKMNFGEGYKRDYEISNERMEDFISELKLILKEIFNSEIPFQENPDKAF